MAYDYRVQALNMSRYDILEDFGERLQKHLDKEVPKLEREGWEFWQMNTLSDPRGGNNGILLVYRRPLPETA